MTRRVAIVGGGVAGLTAAYRISRAGADVDVTVLEEAEPGGRLASVPVGDLELDAGPDSFVARKPWAADLCRELGLTLVEPAVSGAYVWTERGLVPMPASALGIPADVDGLLRFPGLSRAARVRALGEGVRKPRPRDGDEALGSLLRRRLGDAATDALVAPVLAGLHAGDVDRLGVAATFPELARWERDFGSLIRGASAAVRASSTAGPMFVRPAEGVRSLPRALADRVHVRTGVPVTRVIGSADGFTVVTPEGDLRADTVVLATPAFVAAVLVEALAPAAAARLREIPYVSTAVVPLVYAEGTAEALPPVTGFVVPRGRAPMTAASFVSRKWPEPAFGTRAVVRCFVGAAGSEDVVDAPDEDIVGAVSRHLAALLPLPERASASAVVRWPRSMPQYGVGHVERVAAVETALPPGIVVTGNAYHGVGVADTVNAATEVAELVLGSAATSEAEHDRTERVR